MMIEPPIDELVNATGNRYVLCSVTSKRAKEIETVRRAELASEDKKAITLACEEIAKGKIKPSKF